MNVTDIPTTTLDAAPVDERLHDVVRALLADGINVYVYQRPNAVGGYIPSTWIVIERNGNVGGLQVNDLLRGIGVHFDIRPSRETGSSLTVVLDAGKPTERDELESVDDVVTAAHIATQSHYMNFATNGRALPNYGWKSVEWAMRSLVKIVEAAPDGADDGTTPDARAEVSTPRDDS